MTSIFEKILYGVKTNNDNLIAISERLDELFAKVDELAATLTYEEEPNEADGSI